MSSPLVNAVEHEVSKVFIPAKTRAKAAKKGDALPDGSFPIRNRTDLLHARQDLGRTSPGKRAAAKKLIARRAKQLDVPLAKAYTPGSITYHSAAAREEGRKKRSADSVARAGVVTAAASGYAHHAASAGKIEGAKAVKTAGKLGVAAGATLTAGGAVSSVVHGRRRAAHFRAAQAGRLEREPDIAKRFGVDMGTVAKSSLAAVDDIAMAPQKITSMKSLVTGKQPSAAAPGQTVPPAKKKIIAPIAATANDAATSTS